MKMMDSIPEAIEAIRRGEVIIVVDDEDRENEGDFLIAARHATPEVVNFMATHGRGLICAPLIENRCDELGLELMVESNNAAYETPFTVSVDLIGHGCTTGISAQDRSKTIQALIDPKTDPKSLGKPGHIFPLRAKKGGVLRRPGHTEAAIDFSRLAGFEPAGVIVEIMNEDGTMARLPECRELAEKFNLKLVSIADLIEYRLQNETLIERKFETEIQTAFGEFKAIVFKQLTNEVEHLALVKGAWDINDEVPLRVHSTSMVGDVFQITDFGKGPMLHAAMQKIDEIGHGAIIYINKLRKGGGILDELKAYNKLKGTDRSFENKMDAKDYGIGAQIIRQLGIQKCHVLTNTPRNPGPIGYGLEIIKTSPLTP
ncbi:MAG: 3,4-dihydroxy-2-butanone-4-phosphate synthase [Flavobacteriales bacterium]